jgi:hypothetical protein
MNYQPPSIKSVSQYAALFQNLPSWQVAEWILRDLYGYRLMGRNNYLPADRERLANAMAAWLLVAQRQVEDVSWR